MNKKQWEIFCSFRQEFKEKIEEWSKRCPTLASLQEAAAKAAATPPYPLETPVVYNRDLDKIGPEDEIRLIVIGDNPGKDEQLAKNNRYLVGQAGKIAEGYFRRNPVLQVDFRKNVIILNKTPVHSAKTNQLKYLIKNGGEEVKALLEESQLWMAEKTGRLHIDLLNACGPSSFKPEIWLVGYGELRNKKLFVSYRDKLQEVYKDYPEQWQKVFLFQHFSMNRFTIDLDDFIKKENLSLEPDHLLENLQKLGICHRKELFN